MSATERRALRACRDCGGDHGGTLVELLGPQRVAAIVRPVEAPPVGSWEELGAWLDRLPLLVDAVHLAGDRVLLAHWPWPERGEPAVLRTLEAPEVGGRAARLVRDESWADGYTLRVSTPRWGTWTVSDRDPDAWWAEAWLWLASAPWR